MHSVSRTSLVLVAILVFSLATSSSAQTLQEAAAHAGAALAAQGASRAEYNKPLLYTGSAMLGAGIGLVIGGIVYASDCDDYDGFGIIGELAEDECRDAATRRYLFGAAFASGGTALMLLSRPRIAAAAPTISFGPGRATVSKKLTF